MQDLTNHVGKIFVFDSASNKKEAEYEVNYVGWNLETGKPVTAVDGEIFLLTEIQNNGTFKKHIFLTRSGDLVWVTLTRIPKMTLVDQ